MLIDLEFAKTIINAITFKFRHLKSDVEAVKSDVPDWNEPNSASHTYIKNKPCYDYIEPSVVIWKSDSAKTSSQLSVTLVDLVDGWLIEGEEYRLTVDGVTTTYTCAADAYGGGLYIGGGYASPNTGGIYQPYASTLLNAWTKNLWGENQKVRLEGPLRRNKKLSTNLYNAVASVNGETGEVQITPENIKAANAGRLIVSQRFLSAIYGTYAGEPCDTLYLGGTRYFQRGTLPDTREECFKLGPINTPLAGIKTPTYDDCAANKGYVDATVTAARESIKLISSTEGSTKQFEITVNDDGVISATEVVE